MTTSKIFLYFCLSFIVGIFLSSFFQISLLALLAFLILGLLLISIFWTRKKLVVIGFCILFLVLGIWRHQNCELEIRNNELRKLNDLNGKITLIGIVSDEPDIREKSQKLTIKIQKIQNFHALEQGSLTEIQEKILITIWRYPEYRYGDKLKITGKIESPKELEDFNYPGYLAKDGIYSLIYRPEIELIERENYENLTAIIYAQILNFKNKLREVIYQNLSRPQSSILGAMILGDKRQISQEWKDKLNITGVRHITAISGLHVTVLTVILMSFLLALGFWRQQAFYFTIILITLFIVMTGFQASAIRAGIMGSLFLFAQYLGRQSLSARTIFFAGTVMLFQNPLLLKFDVGFQLSFLAMLGIIYLLPIFQECLKFIPWENPKNILAMTFSAYLFTLPILVYNFGYVSLVSPLTNLLIVPLLYWIMLFGLIFALTGIFWQFLGWILSFPCFFLLTYLTKIVDLFSKFPLAFQKLENVHWVWLIISYLILGFITWRLQEKLSRPSFLR